MISGSGIAKGELEWARANPNFPRRAAPARFCYYEQETNDAYLGSVIFSL